MFPKLVSGPIASYAQLQPEFGARDVSLRQAVDGLKLFVFGMALKILLANQLGADLLAISTGVQNVALNYGTPMQRPLHSVPVSEMERYLAEGHFPAGSMGPKIKAAVDFIRNGGTEVIITSPEFLNAALTQGAGTHITKG